jgi:hypothetical protein
MDARDDKHVFAVENMSYMACGAALAAETALSGNNPPDCRTSVTTCRRESIVVILCAGNEKSTQKNTNIMTQEST